MEKKYIVCGDYVTSRSDGDRHYMGPLRLCQLYKVSPNECYLLTEGNDRDRRIMESLPKDLPVLRPRADGMYTQPTV